MEGFKSNAETYFVHFVTTVSWACAKICLENRAASAVKLWQAPEERQRGDTSRPRDSAAGGVE